MFVQAAAAFAPNGSAHTASLSTQNCSTIRRWTNEAWVRPASYNNTCAQTGSDSVQCELTHAARIAARRPKEKRISLGAQACAEKVMW